MVERNTPSDTAPLAPASEVQDYTVTVCAFNIPTATGVAQIEVDAQYIREVESVRRVTVQIFDVDGQPDPSVNERQLRREALVAACKLAEELRDEGDPRGRVACKDPIIDPTSWGTPAARALACYERFMAAGEPISAVDLCKLSGTPEPSLELARAVIALALL